MPLTPGTWKTVVNGVEGELEIKSPDAHGVFSGTIHGRGIMGFWNEAAQRIQFAAFGRVDENILNLMVDFLPSQIGLFKGYLFQVPADAEPGRDVTLTLVGTVDAVDPGTKWQSDTAELLGAVPTSRRPTFGWIATIVDVR